MQYIGRTMDNSGAASSARRAEGPHALTRCGAVGAGRFSGCARSSPRAGGEGLGTARATSLASLWQRQRRGPEARVLLGGVLDQFDEGFGTADLVKAIRLLDAMKEGVPVA